MSEEVIEGWQHLIDLYEKSSGEGSKNHSSFLDKENVATDALAIISNGVYEDKDKISFVYLEKEKIFLIDENNNLTVINSAYSLIKNYGNVRIESMNYETSGYHKVKITGLMINDKYDEKIRVLEEDAIIKGNFINLYKFIK